MNASALYKITYGLYVVSATFDGRSSGCIVNTLQQVTSDPVNIAIAINKENYTTQLIKSSGIFSAVVLDQSADMSLIGRFGFKSGRDYNKFAGLSCGEDKNGIPFLMQSVAARFSCKLSSKMDLGTHVILAGKVTEAEVLGDGVPLSYRYYRDVIKGSTPKNAPSYKAEPGEKSESEKLTTQGTRKFRCAICGYVYEGDFVPEDFICPICGAPASQFHEI